MVETSVRRRVTVFMVSITVVLFGLIALSDLKVNLLPDLSYPTLTVRTEYTGAAPSEIETLISEPVEEAVGVVKNLRKLRSVSRTGQSDVILEFAWGTDMDQAGLEVRDKLEILSLPLEAKPPVLLRFNPSTEPIVRLVLTGTEAATGNAEAELMRLRRFADDELKKRLEPVAGVAAVKVGGGLEDEVQVLIDQQKLAQLRLPIETVIDRLNKENVNISGGRLDEGTQRYLVRTINQFAGIEEMRNLLVTTGSGGTDNSAAQEAAAAASRIAALSPEAAAASAAASAAAQPTSAGPAGGLPVRLRDIATVEQGYKEREAIIRLGGEEAVELAIYKEGDANTVNVADAVHVALDRLKNDLPAGAKLTVVEDQAIFIRQALHDVRFDALIGGTLAILMIFFFLRDGWSTFVISLSLPISIVATFFFMGQFGLSLNVMSLGGLALATGLVVDDSIVVLESIAKARERGLGVLQAAVTGTQEVSMAVIASTLTNVAVFLPLVFVEGVAGQLFRDQALTVSLAILMSLAVSLTLIPMLSALKATSPLGYAPEAPYVRPPAHNAVARGFNAASHGIARGLGAIAFAVSWLVVKLFRGLRVVFGTVLSRIGDVVMLPYNHAAAAYARLLPGALNRPALVLGVALAAFLGALALVPTLGLDLIPQLAQDRFEMTVKLPAGTQLRDTDALVRSIQSEHESDDGIQALYGVSGTGTRLDANPTESGENIGKLTIVMERGHDAQTEARLTEGLRETMRKYPGAEVKFGRPEIFSFSTPLEIELRGQDLGELQQAGTQLSKLLQGSDRFADVKSTVEDGFPEIQIRFDQERAAALGLTTRQIADNVVRKVRGEVATRYSFRDRKIDVLVRAQESDRASVDDIRRLIVNPESARPVTLDAVAEVVATTGPSEIHRADQVRVAVISANLRYGDLGSAVAEVRELVAQNPLAAGVGMHIGGQGEELTDSLNSLIFAFTLAIFLVYLVMASQFESLLHPFVILFTIPLAIVGAVLALVLSGSSISVVVFIGLILLVGIVVKNAIILIDKVNQLREEGVPKVRAIIGGATSRLRPIVMTTLTALLGFLPLAIGHGEGTEVRAPMAITVIGGLAVSTLLTLFVIPVVYKLLDRRPDAFYVQRAKPIMDAGAAEQPA
ncbi:HAE1 family hydrophobic/amphiphilic exporter-1 [Chiayiivirga flava]|uniref:HAE1 family hydrophobic/amphiphilic exporter-1 n=1 Tax=Chiayiivirga flava TaxID=659595 RepID=A0A7W8FZY1_9GAMM|nr:HAE1 family hydrophobic/amphiphilic exporter-1 [Chiayiivirga flava]